MMIGTRVLKYSPGILTKMATRPNMMIMGEPLERLRIRTKKRVGKPCKYLRSTLLDLAMREI